MLPNFLHPLVPDIESCALVGTRYKCPACRLQKCYQVGMKESLIRGPNESLRQLRSRARADSAKVRTGTKMSELAWQILEAWEDHFFMKIVMNWNLHANLEGDYFGSFAHSEKKPFCAGLWF